MPFQLAAAERAHFEREGWVGPFPLLSASEAHALEPELARCFALTRGYYYPPDVAPGDSFYTDASWFQSLHTLSPAIAAVGRPHLDLGLERIDSVPQIQHLCLEGGKIDFGVDAAEIGC